MRIRKRNIAWLSALAALIGVAFISGTVTAEVMTVLVGVFAVAFVASMLEFQPARWRETMATSPLTRLRMSNDAREAAERARRRLGGYAATNLTLLDIGLISSQASPEGMVMRKSRTISGDEDGVRPFISLHVPPGDADRNALVRFEIIDQNGEQRYVHEMRTYLRDGEMNILADHHLPLLHNPGVGRTGGEWDLRVSVDSTSIAMLSFAVSPSIIQRDREIERLADPPSGEIPLSFEDLMRGQEKQSKG
ncbi:MAG: hypothetical protein K8J31_19320 [Anaerolineae bacterium]|nr:hypothetical protein [Anaerolineae bacterium]